MLSAADNELLTRTGPGTGMGEYFRRFWIPVLLSQELPERDGPPLRVKVMGEDLIAFRDSQNRVGLIEPHCPHRGANLFWGRNEECGIRCAFHGWKFDVTGRCVDMPSVPSESGYQDKIRIKAYPTREWGDFVWAYMGPPELEPALPLMEFALVPPSHRYVSKKLQQCNWAQACEGALDTAHFSFLHMVTVDDEHEAHALLQRAEVSQQAVKNDRIRWVKEDRMPKFAVLPHEAGLVIGASRKADDDLYWRISQFLLPNHALAPNAFPGENYHGQTWVPIDDHHCWIYCYTWNPDRPLTDEERAKFRDGHTVHAQVDANWVPLRNRSNDYLIDRNEQKLRTFTGITGVSEQDACIQDSQGYIADRTREHLGPTDIGIVRFRRTVLDGVKQLAQGKEPAAASKPAGYAVRSGGTVAPAAQPLAEVMKERFGDARGYVGELYSVTRTPAVEQA